MFNHFLNFLRGSFSRNRTLKLINVTGLAIALAASLIIVFYVQHETSYDRHWQHADRIYRLNNNFNLPGRAPYRLATTSSLLIPALQEAFAEDIELAARARTLDVTYRVEQASFRDIVVAVDPAFNDIFAVNAVMGSLQDTLANTRGIALSETMARRFFGSTDVIDKTLSIEYPSSTVDYRVAAVYEMPAGNSILELPALIRFDEALEPALALASLGTWYQAPVASYVKLQAGVDADTVRAGLDAISDNNVDMTPMSPGPNDKPSDLLFFDMSNISALHLDSAFQNVRGAGNRLTVQAFAVIAALIVLIACINFSYLTLARSEQRASEVGIRKILGASKQQILLQYLGESFVLVGVALLLGLALLELLLPWLVNVLALPLQVDYTNLATYGNILAVYLLVALLGGSYPALMLSRFRPAAVLRSRITPHANALVSFKNVLLLFQFGVAIALIIATSVMYLQVEFVSQRDPGFRQDNLLFLDALSGRPAVNANKELLRQRIEALPEVASASLSSYHPTATTTYARVSSAHGLEGRPGETFILANTFIDENFLPTYGIALAAGRNFSREQDQPVLADAQASAAAAAAGSAMINEAAAAFLGFASADDAIGKFIIDRYGETESAYVIIGVVAENQFYSLKAVARPEIYFFAPYMSDVLAVHYQGSAQALMNNVEAVWRGTMGGAELAVSFIEPLLASEFSQERREGQMFVVFSLFAIFIACLGLYGASAFSVERRTREIGIRRVIGAELREIIALLLWQFSKPVLCANAIAWPLALWSMLNWLRRFPYQIDALLLIPLCVLAGAIALSIAWLTITGSTLRVASEKPVLALRYE